ncbi:MAG: SsrA-binding protein SmpB [Planctomycetota bacterium]|nr:MAG: SsrA-binding protein SmpB [Planctomycetota bacterium]
MAKSRKRSANQSPNDRLVCRNRRARHDYEILQQWEAGLALLGSEVKSIRDGKISLEEAYVRYRDGELWLVNAHIAEYPQANVQNHDPLRPRKLLLHRREIRQIRDQIERPGVTAIPLEVYLKRGLVKLRVAVARGRKQHDKREVLRKKADEREIREALRRR